MTAEFDGAAVAGSGPTVGELFRSRAKVQPTSVAIEYLGRNISYGELLAAVDAEGFSSVQDAIGADLK